MSPLSIALEKGFERYYNTLVQTGNVSKKQLSNLIIASWINDVLEGKYDCLVDDEQYNILSDLYTCVEGSCLVPYQNYCTDITVNKLPISRYIRVIEQTPDAERILEVDNNIRTI